MRSRWNWLHHSGLFQHLSGGRFRQRRCAVCSCFEARALASPSSARHTVCAHANRFVACCHRTLRCFSFGVGSLPESTAEAHQQSYSAYHAMKSRPKASHEGGGPASKMRSCAGLRRRTMLSFPVKTKAIRCPCEVPVRCMKEARKIGKDIPRRSRKFRGVR